MHSIIVSCPRGLEEKLQEELLQITAKPSIVQKGHVQLKGSWRDIYAINLHSRLASRVLLEIKRGTVHSETELYQLSKKINWPAWFNQDKTFRVRAEGETNWCRRFDVLALIIKDAVCDVFMQSVQQRPNVDKKNPNIRISAYIYRNSASIYLDTSGEALFKRGWRQQTDLAPIRENLAAGLLKLANYDGDQAFMDVMCGSGTIAIEAAMIASNTPPGLQRTFSFQHFNEFNANLWQQLLLKAKKGIRTPAYPIEASDNNPSTLQKAIHNANKAGFGDCISFNGIAFNGVTPKTPHGLLLSNPPYGQRLSEIEQIQAQYPGWSSTLKKNFAGWTAGFITSDTSFPSILRLSPKRRIPIYNGKTECRLYLFDIVSGSNRE